MYFGSIYKSSYLAKHRDAKSLLAAAYSSTWGVPVAQWSKHLGVWVEQVRSPLLSLQVFFFF